MSKDSQDAGKSGSKSGGKSDSTETARDAGTVVDASTIAVTPVVQVDVKVVEFSKSVLKEAGFNLFKQNNAFAFGTLSPASLTSYTGGATTGLQVQSTSPISGAFNLLINAGTRGIFGNLSLLESNNLARVLAEPTLVALSGQSANFLAGGEIPVPVPQALGATSIVYKPYGIGLTLTPTVLGAQRIALKVAPEASQLDFTHALTINGIQVPAITTRRADTTVELGDGESFVIGGLIDRETASNVDKVPMLGDLPIIGAFFKTSAVHAERSRARDHRDASSRDADREGRRVAGHAGRAVGTARWTRMAFFHGRHGSHIGFRAGILSMNPGSMPLTVWYRTQQ